MKISLKKIPENRAIGTKGSKTFSPVFRAIGTKGSRIFGPVFRAIGTKELKKQKEMLYMVVQKTRYFVFCLTFVVFIISQIFFAIM